MRFFSYEDDAGEGLGIVTQEGASRGLSLQRLDLSGLDEVIASGKLNELETSLASAPPLDAAGLRFLSPVRKPGKILCVGLNYADHSKEVGLAGASYPTIFARFANGLIAHGASLVRPRVSHQFDYEGELAVIIGRRARHVSEAEALEYVAGYSIFNDGSVRDYQTKTSQWTMGKNFDGTAALGPWLVTADELPHGARGLRVVTRLNGEVMQDGNTSDFIFDVPKLIALMSEVMTLEPGDIIATGTPSGVGVARNPPVFMKSGDLCEIEIEGVGLLSNSVVDEAALPSHLADRVA